MNHKIVNVLHNRTITVTQAFIEYRDQAYESGNAFQSREKCDSLLLEWWVLNNTFADEPEIYSNEKTNWRYDWGLDGMRIDNKEINYSHWNISDAAMNKIMDSINKNFITHFLLYESIRPERLLEAGDVVTFKLLNFVEARDAINAMWDSNYGGKYLPKTYLKKL